MRAVILIAIGLSLVSCRSGGGGSPIGVELRKRTQFESEWSGYLKLSGFKALAVAGDLRGVYASGYAHSYPLSSLAVEEALEWCEERRVDRGIEEACRTYAIGDERVDGTE